MRIPLIAGNWKLNKTVSEAVAFVRELQPMLADVAGVETVVGPVFTALAAVSEAARGSAIGVAGQDLFWKESGAYTGEVSATLLLDAGCTHVIIGHSERRGRFGVPDPELEGDAGRIFGDTDASVNKKLRAAVAAGLVPLVCVGETLRERQDGLTDETVRRQTTAALDGITPNTSLVLAYEPVWAIGTGETCDTAEAGRVCGVIRGCISKLWGDPAAEQVRVQYGGSVKPDNAAELLAHRDIDGALVGGASLKVETFVAIVRAAGRGCS